MVILLQRRSVEPDPPAVVGTLDLDARSDRLANLNALPDADVFLLGTLPGAETYAMQWLVIDVSTRSSPTLIETITPTVSSPSRLYQAALLPGDYLAAVERSSSSADSAVVTYDVTDWSSIGSAADSIGVDQIDQELIFRSADDVIFVRGVDSSSPFHTFVAAIDASDPTDLSLLSSHSLGVANSSRRGLCFVGDDADTLLLGDRDSIYELDASDPSSMSSSSVSTAWYPAHWTTSGVQPWLPIPGTSYFVVWTNAAGIGDRLAIVDWNAGAPTLETTFGGSIALTEAWLLSADRLALQVNTKIELWDLSTPTSPTEIYNENVPFAWSAAWEGKAFDDRHVVAVDDGDVRVMVVASP